MEFQARKQFHRNNAFVMAAFTIGRLSGRTTSGDLNNPNVLANAIGEVGGGHLSASPQRRVHPSRSRQSIRKLSVSNWSAIHAVLHREHDDRSGIDPADLSLNLVKPGPERLPNLNLLDCSTWRFSRPFRSPFAVRADGRPLQRPQRLHALFRSDNRGTKSRALQRQHRRPDSKRGPKGGFLGFEGVLPQ